MDASLHVIWRFRNRQIAQWEKSSLLLVLPCWRAREGGGYSFVACLSRLSIDHVRGDGATGSLCFTPYLVGGPLWGAECGGRCVGYGLAARHRLGAWKDVGCSCRGCDEWIVTA